MPDGSRQTGITGEGTKVAVEESQRAVDAGAVAGLIYPSHGWLRFGYQDGAPQDRYRAIWEETGLPEILFQYPDITERDRTQSSPTVEKKVRATCYDKSYEGMG